MKSTFVSYIITFDIFKNGESKTSLAAGKIIAYWEKHGKPKLHQLRNISFDKDLLENDCQLSSPEQAADYIYNYLEREYILSNAEFLFLGAYVWADELLKILLKKIRVKHKTKIWIGGYQIKDRESALKNYPEADGYITGYAEKSVTNVLTGKLKGDFIYLEPDYKNLPSPYLDGQITVPQFAESVRIESRRGCYYRCSYCAHRDTESERVNELSFEIFKDEIHFLAGEKRVKKINLIDPVIKLNDSFFELFSEVFDKYPETLFSFQCHPDLLKTNNGMKFLNLIQGKNVILELGLQSIHENECNILKRKTNLNNIRELISKFKDHNIKSEWSLIYGIPGQTPESLKQSVDFLRNKQIPDPNIKLFPLTVLPGTDLFREQHLYKIRTEQMGKVFRIPVVVSCENFSKENWKIMNDFAENSM